jgi:sugar lactone lactonase YvrE
MASLRYIVQLLCLSMGACLVMIQVGTQVVKQFNEREDGNSLAQFSSPVGVVADKNYIYFIDHDQHRVLGIDKESALHLIAGNGNPKASGDGGSATLAGMYIIGLTADQRGNLYLADHGNNRIRKIDLKGRITTIAGTGQPGFSGDGGPAIKAKLYGPVGMAVDRQGNIYITDFNNHRVRKIDPQGIITTIAGTGKPGFGKDNTPAPEAALNSPWGITVDCQQQVLFTDLGSGSIKRIVDGKLTTVIDKLARPTGLAMQCTGSETLYISDTSSNKIFTYQKGNLQTIAGADPKGIGDGAPALYARLNAPYSLALDDQGQLLIADTSNNRIRIIDRNGFITTLLKAKF